MKRQLLLFSIVITTAFVSQSALANNKCAELLSGVAEHETRALPVASGSLQDRIKSQESSIKTLIQEYGQRLGPFQDPFALAFSSDQGDRIFKRLSVRAKDGKWINSPLSIINFNLKRAYSGQRGYNEKLIQWMIDDAAYWLRDSNVDRADIQSNLLALKYAVEYLRRYKEPETVVDRDGKKEEGRPEQTKEQQQKQEGQEQDQPPEYPELPKEYKPFTKDTQNQGSGKQKQHRVAEVNFKTPFFAQRYFSEIVRGAKHPFQQAVLPTMPSQPSKYQQTGREQIVRTFGKRKVDLFLPPLFKPLQPTDPRAVISQSETGGYVLELKEDLSEIHIPLTEDVNISMMPHIREVYTRTIGFKTEEWPDKVQADVLRKYPASEGARNPLAIAQAVADHIATEYLYSVGPRPETDPIAALRAGAFQCDMAAYSMVGILRDVYQIPSRVVGGFRAKKHQSGTDGKSYLVVPGEAHSWVEVFHDGKWHLFDPTPIKKDKKDNKNGENEYSDNALDNTPKPENDEQDRQTQQPANPSQGSGQGKDHKQRLEEDTQRRSEGLFEKLKRLIGKDDKTIAPEVKKEVQSDKTQKPERSETDLTKEELADQLELGSLELEPRLDRNALLERAVRVLLQTALDPTKQGSDIQNRLNQISSLMRRFNSPQVKAIYQKALSAHSGEHPELKNWVDQLTRMMPGQDVNKTYQELHKIKLALEVYSKVLDPEGKIRPPEQLMEVLDQVQKRIGALAHPDSQDIGLVQDLVKNLPSVARLLLKNQFDLSTVGPNNPTKEVARQLKAGKLNDMRLMSILSPLSDFILNSTPRPETIEVRTWQRDTARPRGRDLLPLQRFSDLPRAILAQPGKSAEDNIREGTAYLPTRRQRVQIPAGYGKEESERITIVLYDTSGSMSGDPGRFQAGLISAFTGKALSDISPSGKHRHRVLIVPFDTTPGTAIRVTNTQEALDVIRNYQQKLKNTGGGTDIQKALLQAMSLIADAERRSGEPLAAANIVLMTDGQAEINADELLQARRAIDRQTPLQTMFIAINQTNEELMRFAMDSQKMGAERGFYREFTPEHIKDILNEADTLNLKGRNDFYTDKTAKELPAEIYHLMDQALRLAAEFSDQIYYGSQFISAREHLENLEKVKWRDVKQVDRPLEKWLIKVRQLVQHPVFKDRRILERVVDDLVTHIDRLTGVKTNEMSDHEQEQLRHLVRYAAGLEEGVW